MCSTAPKVALAPRRWTQPDSEFFISNDPALLSVKAVNQAFGREFLYWENQLPDEVMHQKLYGAMSFGVYKQSQPQPDCVPNTSTTKSVEQIGLARMITDGITFGYLSDVYVLPEYQGYGLGGWLMSCVAEVFSLENMPYLRRIMLLTNDERMQKFYRRVFGMEVIGHERRPDIGQDLVFRCVRPTVKS